MVRTDSRGGDAGLDSRIIDVAKPGPLLLIRYGDSEPRVGDCE